MDYAKRIPRSTLEAEARSLASAMGREQAIAFLSRYLAELMANVRVARAMRRTNADVLARASHISGEERREAFTGSTREARGFATTARNVTTLLSILRNEKSVGRNRHRAGSGRRS